MLMFSDNRSRAFTKAGYHIACIGRSSENLSKLGKEISEAGGYVSYQVANVSLYLTTQTYSFREGGPVLC